MQIKLETIKQKIIEAYAEQETNKEIYRMLGCIEYAHLKYGRSDIDGTKQNYLLNMFIELIERADVRSIVEALPKLDRANIPKWVKKGEYIIDITDDGWVFYRNNA